MVKRTSQGERRMWSSLKVAVGGRLLIGSREVHLLPSAGDQDEVATGSSTVNVEPVPGSDSTQIRPCIRSTSSRQM
jgi:hypothetical protein